MKLFKEVAIGLILAGLTGGGGYAVAGLSDVKVATAEHHVSLREIGEKLKGVPSREHVDQIEKRMDEFGGDLRDVRKTMGEMGKDMREVMTKLDILIDGMKAGKGKTGNPDGG